MEYPLLLRRNVETSVSMNLFSSSMGWESDPVWWSTTVCGHILGKATQLPQRHRTFVHDIRVVIWSNKISKENQQKKREEPSCSLNTVLNTGNPNTCIQEPTHTFVLYTTRATRNASVKLSITRAEHETLDAYWILTVMLWATDRLGLSDIQLSQTPQVLMFQTLCPQKLLEPGEEHKRFIYKSHQINPNLAHSWKTNIQYYTNEKCYNTVVYLFNVTAFPSSPNNHLHLEHIALADTWGD